MSATAAKSEPLNGAVLFATTDDFFAALFGPQQHDHHVKARNLHARVQATVAAYDKANEAVAAHVREMIARDRARRFA